jgi:hypothetical protein
MVENRLSAVGAQDKLAAPAANGQGARAVLWGENHASSAQASPSANGANGGEGPPSSSAAPVAGAEEPAADAPATAAGRGPGGRFAKGNPGGTGNPFARQVAALRQAALAAITPDQVRAILAKMAELALAGDVQAAKLVLAYAIGRPAAAPDPDRLDVEEWNHFKEAAPMLGEAGSLLTPDPAVLLDSVRRGRQATTRDYADILAAALLAPEQPLPSLLGHAGRSPKEPDPTTRQRRR